MTTEGDETATPPTKQQKLIKAGLLLGLALVIVYVVLDYTVSQPTKQMSSEGAACSTRGVSRAGTFAATLMSYRAAVTRSNARCGSWGQHVDAT